jgi:predicted phage tail protein
MGKKYGKTVKLAGENMFQLMSGLVSRLGPQFKEDVRLNNWHLIRGKMKDKRDIGEAELKDAIEDKEIHLVPAVAGKSSALRVVLGVVIFAVGVYFNQPWIMSIGATMALGGVAEMLTKPPTAQAQQKQDDKGSFIYNGAVNVSSQGGPVPLLYGRVQRASSVLISTDFSSDDI